MKYHTLQEREEQIQSLLDYVERKAEHHLEIARNDSKIQSVRTNSLERFWAYEDVKEQILLVFGQVVEL